MAIPLKYNFRNLVVRRTTTLMTALSITLTVAVFIILMALAEGLQSSLTSTGNPLNVLIMREGAQSEAVSFVDRDALQIIKYLHGIAKDKSGNPWVDPELIILMNFPAWPEGWSECHDPWRGPGWALTPAPVSSDCRPIFPSRPA